MIKTIALFMFLAGVFVFGMSYHNVDLSVNMQYGAIDVNGVGFTQDRQTMYVNGMTGLGGSMIMLISGFSLLFGAGDRRWLGTHS